ncbi:MAG: VCBS repeat-containing protein [Anaeromyxobacter sp.]
MSPVALLLAAALAAPPAAPPPAALADAAGRLAAALGPPAEGRRALALSVETRAPALASPLAAALEAALAQQGYAVTRPPRGQDDPEGAARAAGQDWLLHVQGGLVPGRPELALVGEAIPAWASFFLQRHPGVRPVPPKVLQARVAVDPETLLLAREHRPAGAPFATLRTLGRVHGPVLALAVGDPGGGGLAIAAALPATDLLLTAQGGELARRELDPAGWRPVRAPAAAVVMGPFGGGRLAVTRAGAPRAEVLVRRGDRLEAVAALASPALCAGEAGRLFGQYAPGAGALLDALSPTADPGTPPRSPRLLAGVAAAPRGGAPAFAALAQDGRLELLDAALRPVGPPLPGVGAGFALADLDGDGAAEVVASSPAPTAPDRLRVLATRPDAPPLLESPPFDGLIQAAAAGDLTGDGVDDAVLAVVGRGADGAPFTDLVLVTADPRELP